MMPKAVNWIENEFFIPETRHDPRLQGRIALQPYQRDALHEILTPDDNGKYKYSIVVWSDIKKSGKSTIAAAVNLYRATFTEYGEFYVIANDLKQADSRVAHYMRRAVELNPKMRSKYKMQGYRITAPSGAYVEAIPIDPSGEAGTNADMVTFSELWGAHEEDKQKMWCLDDQTEALTKEGFKRGIDLTTDDEIAVYSCGTYKWEKPREVFNKEFTGKMHTYEHKHFSLWCTDDHRLYGRYSANGGIPEKESRQMFGVVRSNELRESKYDYYHPVVALDKVTCDDSEQHDIYIPATKFKKEKIIPWKKWVAFMGLYLTEGHTSDFRGVPCKVRVSQLRKPHPEKYDEIYSILKDCFGDWLLIDKKDGFTIASTEVSKLTKPLGKTWTKRVPREIVHGSKDIIATFLHSYILGDGSINENGRVSITCASKGMADDLHEMAFRLGFRTSLRPHVNKYWRLYITEKETPTVSVQKKHWKEIDYSGRVWCPSVSTGLFVARRNGWIFITGNTEMTIPPMKHGRAFRWIESYAGFAEESDLLYSLYELGVKQGELLWPERLYEVTDGDPTPLELYVNRSAGMICLWNTQPRCPWQTREYYSSEEKILPPNQFQRIHRNQWVSSTETFVPMEWVYACQRKPEDWPVINVQRQPMVVSMDAGVSNDNFGMWMGCRHPDKPDEVLTMLAQKWVPDPHTKKIDFMGTEENPGPELLLRRLVKEYNVIQVCFDPFQLHDMSMRLKHEGLAWIRAFSQGQDRLMADSQLRDLIRDRRFWHRGEPVLIEHLQNADAKIDDQDSKVRLVKRAERMKIDVAVAASMGSYTLLYLNL
jgi:phage terminase large subunit-like protein